MKERELINLFPDATGRAKTGNSYRETRRLRRAVWMLIFAITTILFCLTMIGLIKAFSQNGGW